MTDETTGDDPLAPSGLLQAHAERLLQARSAHDWHPDIQEALAGVEADLRRIAREQAQLERAAMTSEDGGEDSADAEDSEYQRPGASDEADVDDLLEGE